MPPTHQFDYQLETFDPAPDEELICSICRCVFFDPVECPCRHVFCEKCITQWLATHKSCPACRKRISKSSLQEVVPIIRNMIMKLTLFCRNSDRGCEAKCTVELYESHLKTCAYETLRCENRDCDALLLRMNKEKHEQVECQFRRIRCPVCDLSVMFSNHMSHNCVQELLHMLREKEQKITELQEENDILKQEIKRHKDEEEKSRNTGHVTSDNSDFDSVSSISMSPSSNYEDSDLEDYSVRIYSVIHPNDGISVSASVESRNVEPSSVHDINRTDLPMDSTNNHSDDSQKSSSPDYLDSIMFPPVVSSSSRGISEHLVNSGSVLNTESFSESPRRSLKRRMQTSLENRSTLDHSTRSSPPRSPIYDNFCGSRRSRLAYSDTETPRTATASANALGSPAFPRYQNLEHSALANETVEILDSSTEDASSSNVFASVPSSSYTVSESSQSSNPSVNVYAFGSSTSSSQDRAHSKLLRQRGFKGMRGRSHFMDKNSASNIPRSRVPVPVGNPGSSSGSASAFHDQEISNQSVRNNSFSSEASDDISPSRVAFITGLKKTISLLKKYTGKDSDPDWVPSNDHQEESDSSCSSTSSSKGKSPQWREDLRYCSPTDEQERESASSDSSSSNSESWATDVSETDSSYEVEVPPSAWDLIQRYCNEDDSDDDSEWIPASGSNSH